MINKLIPVLLILSISVNTAFAQEQVTVNMNVPEQVNAGEDFDVTITVQKSSLEEFSRFQQELPAGLTAKPANSGTADFSFENQRIRFIWLKLPPYEQLTISYKISVHERLKGTFNLDGEFSYVENNQRKSVKVSSGNILIIPSGSLEESMLVDISDFAGVMASEKAARETKYDITCIRQTPYLSGTSNDIIVNLLVYKKGIDKFAKIEEQIPDGFEARNIDSKEGIFTFMSGIAKFVWMNLPVEPGFVVSYRLLPAENKTLDNLNIRGQFSYIEEGRNVALNIIQKNIDLRDVSADNADEVMAAIASGQTILPVTKERTTVETPVARALKEKETEQGVRKVENIPAESRNVSIPPNVLLPVEDGIYYRVQLAASHRQVSINQAFNNYNLDRSVKIEFHNGWYKYTVGSFNTYVSAQQYKNRIISEKGINDAFITAYRNGIRIDVLEALKLTGEVKY